MLGFKKYLNRVEGRGSSFSVFCRSRRKNGWILFRQKKEINAPASRVKSRRTGRAGLVVGVILAVGVALLQGQGCGRGAWESGGGGAGGFDPGLGEQGGGDGGGGGHGDLDELVALYQPDESFEALERSLSVSLLPQQSLPQVHTLLRTQETPQSTSCQAPPLPVTTPPILIITKK